ncbi:MAG TPA: DUF3105 domain-containing protein [Actinomycetota bacterium]|nr:DUF3105 domain-containing protein [Actinomycetota bacterium]
MANQKRETKRERRDEAKRRRLEELKRRQRRERMRKLMFGGVGAAIIVGIILLVTLLGGGGNSAELNRLATAAGCSPIQKHGNEGSTHVNPPQSVTYKTNPPTSGNHYSSPSETGIHVAAIQNEIHVHNLEHGHIMIQYQQSLDRTILEALYLAVKADPKWLVIAPSPSIPAPLTFSAWEHSQICNTPTTPQAVAAALNGFVDAHKDNGPESIAGTARAGTETATPPVSTASPAASPTPSPTATSP